MKQRILILANNDVGLYQFRRELLERLLELGNEVYISLPQGKLVQPLVDRGCIFVKTDVDRRGINPRTDLNLIQHYRKIMDEVRPDLVLTYTIKPNIYGGIVCRQKHIPYAVNITGLGTAFQRENLLKKFVTVLYKFALRDAKIIFFENSENMKIFQQLGICKKKSQCKLLNGAGVNLEHYSYAEYPTIDEPVHFLFVGRIMKEKGIDELFQAMDRLTKEPDAPRCVLDVLGSYEENYSERIQKYQEAGWLNYHGYQEDVRPYIEQSHCFVLPSWHEGMANTNLECAAMGRPVITSNIPGCKEAVLDGKSGYLCESQNVESLLETLRKFLALSHSDRIQMGQQGRLHMEQVFDKNNVVESTIECLFD